MEKQQLTTHYTVYDSMDELKASDKALMERAIVARKQAYAPYSKFSVGAAILLDNDTIVIGSNQENAAYPSGLCAERVAIYNAGSTHPNTAILKIAISASSSIHKVDQPIAPCGACRQSIAEFEQKQDEPIIIFFMGETGKVTLVNSLKDLLPFGFDKSYL